MNLLDLTPASASGQLDHWIAQRGEARYRSQQIHARLWRRPVKTWDAATELPMSLRKQLTDTFPLIRPFLCARQRSTDGTIKFLWRFPDGAEVESVLIPEGKRVTLCISSQAGCAYGCTFCATGRMGFERHLTPSEITCQVREMLLNEDLPKLTNVVFMGMGEPLHNWSAVDPALTILNGQHGVGIGARRITVSTIGIVPNLLRLAARPEQFRVALSLHSATSEKRRALMPIEQKYPLRDVLEVLRRFPKRVTFEYVMIKDVNDSSKDAAELARIALELGALVNLLPLHSGGARDLLPTREEEIRRFADQLRHRGIKTTVRKSRGLDINAACGQLRIARGRHGIASQEHAHVQ